MKQPVVTLDLVRFDEAKQKATEMLASIELHKPVGIFDEEGIKISKRIYKDVKALSNDIEALRVELKAPALEFGRKVDAYAKELQAIVSPKMLAAKKIIDDIEADRQAHMLKRRNERTKRITDAGAVFSMGAYRVGTLVYTAEVLDIDSDETFDAVVSAIEAEKVSADKALTDFQAMQKARAAEVVTQPTAAPTASGDLGFDFFAGDVDKGNSDTEYHRGANAMREVAIAAIQRYSKKSEMISAIKES